MCSPGTISLLFFPVFCPEIPKASLGRFFFQWGNVLFSHIVEFTNWMCFSLCSVLQDALIHAKSLWIQLSIAWVWTSQHRLLSGTRFCNLFWFVLPWRYFLHAGVFKTVDLYHFGNNMVKFFYHFAIVIHPFKHVINQWGLLNADCGNPWRMMPLLSHLNMHWTLLPCPEAASPPQKTPYLPCLTFFNVFERTVH